MKKLGKSLPNHTQVLETIVCWAVEECVLVMALVVVETGKRATLAVSWI